MLKLDRRDKIILYELDKNARQPLTKICKKVNLSRESVLYRIKKYFEHKLIRNYLSVIDMSKLGYTHYKVYLKLHNITETQEKALVQELCKNHYISWVASCDGEFSLIYGIKAKSVVELNWLMKEINSKIWKYVMKQEITAIVDAHHFYRDYLVGKKGTTERKIMWGGEVENIKLDKINIIILDEIAKNSRVNSVEIADKTRISPDAIISRIKKLENQGVIEHYMIWPNVNNLAGIFYKVLIRLHNLTPQKEKDLIAYCLSNPNIVYLVNSIGSWQSEIDIEIENIESFRELMRDLLKNFSDIISDYSSLNIHEEYKFIFFEKEIFK